MFRNFKTLLFVLVILTIAGAAYAFAANNTIAASNAGYGTSTISGYAIDSVVYNLDDADPKLVNQITFSISGSVEPALVKLNVTAPESWKDCSYNLGTALCAFTPAIPLTDITKFDVVASSSLNPEDN